MIDDFSSRGENDMILRNVNTGGVEVYDLSNNQITGAAFMSTVGLNWQIFGSKEKPNFEVGSLPRAFFTMTMANQK